MAEKLRYSDEELQEFKNIINEKLRLARRDFNSMMQQLMNADGNGVEDIGFAGEAAYALVGLLGKVERLGDNVHLLAVVGCQIGFHEVVEGRRDETLVFLLLRAEGFGRVFSHGVVFLECE